MKLVAIAIAISGIAAAMWRPNNDSQSSQVLILTGDTNGNLAPCGCTKPMIGGIKRRIEAIKQLSIPGHTTLVDNGNLVAGIGRQDQIKAQAIAEILGAAKYDAINIGPRDARLGLGFLLSMNGVANNAFIASDLQPDQQNNYQQFVVSPPFFVIGVSADPADVAQPLGAVSRSVDEAIREGTDLAKQGELAPILLLQGNHSEAERLARVHPRLKLIEYSSGGGPTEEMEKIGSTVLVSPGADGKHILKLNYSGGAFVSFAAVELGPLFKDEPTAARLYRNYLSRINEEHLLEKLPRMSKAVYSGTKTCGSCHQKAMTTWQHSLHSHALQTLSARGHDRDPECLPCHVVGLNSTKGFQSPQQTPDLANVGCESCHGAGAAHSASPKVVRIPKVTGLTCASCHTANTSPNFSFEKFWKRIKH